MMGKRAVAGVYPWVALLVGISIFAGCGKPAGGTKVNLKDDQIHIMKALSLWSAYRSSHGGKAPNSADELKNWAKKLKPAQLEKDYGIKDLDEALTSPNDGKPYGIKPLAASSSGNQKGRPPGMGGMGPQSGVVVYEQSGKDGFHVTVSSMGTPARLSHDDLKKNVPDLP